MQVRFGHWTTNIPKAQRPLVDTFVAGLHTGKLPVPEMGPGLTPVFMDSPDKQTFSVRFNQQNQFGPHGSEAYADGILHTVLQANKVPFAFNIDYSC